MDDDESLAEEFKRSNGFMANSVRGTGHMFRY